MARTLAVLLSIGAIALGAVNAVGIVSVSAQGNGVEATPIMGWSSWSYLRRDPTASAVEAQAAALQSSGLTGLGYDYVNLDDFWYQCPGPQGPAVDQYGRWVTNSTAFPPSGSLDGIAAVASYVHSLGLKFGLYVTPGISEQAVTDNTPILGTPYHADDIADPSVTETNYNCHGMVGIDYSQPGAQDFVNSWADELASWGVDYVKLDGVSSADIPDVQAWSTALAQTGRPMALGLSNDLSISDSATWQQYANNWRTGSDIECYCSPKGSSDPLTSWAKVSTRFDEVSDRQPYGGPGGFNDYDSIEVGNGKVDGLTPAERQAQLSLWAMAASPLILGSNLTSLNPTDLADLDNTGVIAIDQDAIDAVRVVDSGSQQVFAKTEPDGTVIIGLFNASDTASTTVSVSLPSTGITGSADATDVWTGADLGSITGTYSVTLAPGAVQLIRATPTDTGLSSTSPAPTGALSPTASTGATASAGPTTSSTASASSSASSTFGPTASASVIASGSASATVSADPAPTATSSGGSAPTGAVTSPVSGATLAHGTVMIRGRATATGSVARAFLAIQNQATGRWLSPQSVWKVGYQRVPVTLATSGAASTTWSLALRIPASTVVAALVIQDAAGRIDSSPRPSVAFTLH